MKKEKRTEQVAMKVEPSVRADLDRTLMDLGFEPDEDGQVKCNQEALLEMMACVHKSQFLDKYPERKEEIVSFDQTTAMLRGKYLLAVEDRKSAEDRIRTEFEEKIGMQDKTILALQQQNTDLKEKKNNAENTATEAKKALTIAEKELEEERKKEQKLEESVSDKTRYIEVLSSKLAEAEEKLEGYDALKATEVRLKDELREAHHSCEIKEIERNHEQELRKAAEGKLKVSEAQLHDIQKECANLNGKFASLQQEHEEERSRNKAASAAQQKFAEEARETMAVLREEKASVETKLDMTQKEFDALREEKASVETKLGMMQKEFDALKKEVATKKAANTTKEV